MGYLWDIYGTSKGHLWDISLIALNKCRSGDAEKPDETGVCKTPRWQLAIRAF